MEKTTLAAAMILGVLAPIFVYGQSSNQSTGGEGVTVGGSDSSSQSDSLTVGGAAGDSQNTNNNTSQTCASGSHNFDGTCVPDSGNGVLVSFACQPSGAAPQCQTGGNATWDSNACRWSCGTGVCNPPNGAFACPLEPDEISWTGAQTAQWDTQQCRWRCEHRRHHYHGHCEAQTQSSLTTFAPVPPVCPLGAAAAWDDNQCGWRCSSNDSCGGKCAAGERCEQQHCGWGNVNCEALTMPWTCVAGPIAQGASNSY